MISYDLYIDGCAVATEVGRDQLGAMVVAISQKHGGCSVEVQPVHNRTRERLAALQPGPIGPFRKVAP